MAKSNRQLLITLGADTTTFSQKVKRAKDLTKELDSNFKLLSSSSKEFENSLDGLAKKQEYLNDKIRLGSTLNDVYNERLADQQDRLNKSTKSMQKLEKELEDLKDVQKKSLDPAEWNAWQKEIDKVEDELKQVRKETRNFQDSVIGLHSAIDKNQTEIQKMNAELAETKIKFDILSRDKTFKEMKKDISETEREFNNIKNSTDGFGRAVSDLHAEKAQLNIQMEKTNKLMSEYSIDIEKSTTEMKQMETKVESLTSELRAMEVAVEKMDGTEKHYKEWSNEMDRLRTELTNSNRILEIHRNRVLSLKDSYNQSENSLRTMEGAVKRVDNEIYNFGRRNNFKQIENHLENLRHEFEILDSRTELLRSRFLNFENSIRGTMRESKLLKEQVKNLRQQFNAQQSAMSEYKLKMQELIVKKQELKNEINELKNSLAGVDEKSPTFVRTKSAMGELERNLENVENEIEDVNNELRQMEIASNNTLTSINNNIQGQARTWDVVGDKIKSVGGAFQSVGGSLQSLGGTMMPLTMGLTALSTGIIKTGTEFNAQITRLGALTGETGDELKKVMVELEEGARDLGSTTQYSATEAAKGLEDFMLAGYNATDAIKAMPIAVQMATADSIELNDATELLTTALSSLGNNSELTGNQVEDLSIIANQMAVNAVATTTDMAGLARSLVKVGGQAENMKIPLSTTNTLLGILGDKGVFAEEAGNALSSILINLTQTSGQSADAMEELGLSAFDANGNIKPIEKTLGELKKKLEGFDGDKQEIILKNMLGGKTQAKTLMKLLQGIDAETGQFTEKYKNLKKELENAPNIDALGQMYKKSTDTLRYEFQTLKSVAEESFLTVFEGIEPQLRDIVTSVTDVIKELTKSDVLKNALGSVLEVIQKLIDTFANLSPEMQETIIKFVTWGAILAPIIMVLGGLFTGVGSIISVFGSLVGGTGKVIRGFGLLKQNGVKLSGFFTDFKGTVGKVVTTLGTKLVGATAGASGAMGGAGLAGVVSGLSAVALPALVIALGAIATSLGENEDALTWLADKWGWFGEFVGGILERFAGFVQLHIGNIMIFFQTLGKMLIKLVSGDWKEIDDAWNEGMAKMGTNTAKSISNLSGESSKAIKHLRKVATKDVQEIGDIFEQTFEKLPTVTTKNVGKVAEDFTKMFADSSGKVISISERNLEILRGTSDSMAVLFAGVTAEMDAGQATEQFKKNMEIMIKTGMTSTDELEKDFKKAGELIEKNLVDGSIRAKENANKVLREFSDIAKGDLESGVNDIVGILQDLDFRGIETLRGMGTNWNAIFGNISDTSKMSSEDMKKAILENIERLGLDTPEKLQNFKDTLKTELDLATTQAGEDGKELGTEILDGVETGVTENAEGTGQTVKDTTKKITENASVGAKEGFQNLPESMRQELEKAGVSINEQGNLIVQDMGEKGKQGAKAYVDEMNAQLPALSGVAGTIQQQLDGINKVRFGGVTKQLSEINRWLGLAKDSAIKTGASLAEITTISFGSSTKGLSEINRWLKDNVNPSAKNVKKSLEDIKSVTFGSTTKGLSEINKWLKDNVTPNAVTAHSKLLTLSKFTFSGVISGLKSVNSWLVTIQKTAGTTRNSLLSVAQAKASGASFEGGEPIPDFGTETYDLSKFTRDKVNGVSMSNFRTTGGFYEPQPIALASPEPIKSSAINDALLKATIEQNQLLLQLLNQQKPVEVAVNMDGRQVAKASARYMESEINLINSRKNRLGGK